MSERVDVLKEVLSWFNDGNMIRRIEEAIEAEEPEPWLVLPAGIPCETYTDHCTKTRLRYSCGNGAFSRYKEDAHPEHLNGYKYPYFRPACLPDWAACPREEVRFLVVYRVKGGDGWGWWVQEPTRDDPIADVIYYEARP